MCRLFSLPVIFVFAFSTSVGFAEDLLFPDDLPDNFEVYAVGTYQGDKPVDAKLDDSTHTVRQTEIVVNIPDKPVVVVLTAYDPVVWRVGRTKKTNIAAVIVSGYHGQAVIGIDKDTPLAVSTYKKKGRFRYFYAYKASKKLTTMNASVKQLLGREIDRFEHAYTGKAFNLGEPPKDKNEVIYSQDLKVNNVAQPKRKAVGQEALNALVKEKKIRLAEKADIQAWVDKASEKYKRFNPDLRVSTYMQVGRTYVVLKEVTLPNDMFGANSRSFIIPKDVPFPKGPKSHNTFYQMEDGTTSGPGANIE